MKLLNQVVNTFATSNLAFLRQTVNRVKENSAHFKIMKRKLPVFSPGIFGLSHCFHYHTQQWVSLRGSLLSVSVCNRHIIACCCYFCRSRPSSPGRLPSAFLLHCAQERNCEVSFFPYYPPCSPAPSFHAAPSHSPHLPGHKESQEEGLTMVSISISKH